ncbi:MAG: HNH endonuclease [Chitinophagaceae bacterium]|nr:HNH endonuclease [Chitinophagaceae bacterium]
MQFTHFHNQFFNSLEGSFSLVTPREFDDSQITLTDFETELVLRYFGPDNILIGNTKSNPEKAKKKFFLYPDYTEITLNLLFPKLGKKELRLYLSTGAGFKPAAGLIWFLYLDHEGKLVIGSMNETEWFALGQVDDLDEDYQNSIANEALIRKGEISLPTPQIRKIQIGQKLEFQRNPLIAAYRLKVSDFKCEINPEHSTFIAEKTKLPFMEAHHFIPIKYQNLFTEYPLDNVDNIICLCPNCHRAFHHAEINHKYDLVRNIYYKRESLIEFSLDYIADFYNIKTPDK